jgi:hypothetical protein
LLMQGKAPMPRSNLTESWQRYSAETGASPNIANATSAELRGFAGFDPRYADDAISLNEQLGNSGFQQQRAEQERSVEFLNSHVGVLESNRAANLYPDDPEAQSAHMLLKQSLTSTTERNLIVVSNRV